MLRNLFQKYMKNLNITKYSIHGEIFKQWGNIQIMGCFLPFEQYSLALKTAMVPKVGFVYIGFLMWGPPCYYL